MEWLSKVTEWIKLNTKQWLAIALTTGVLLFVNPTSFADIGLESFVLQYKQWIGLMFLISGTFLVSPLIIQIIETIKEWIKKKIKLAHMKDRLNDLTPEEKQILLGYILPNTRTQVLSYRDGVVSGLKHENIIYQSTTIGDILEGFPYNIQSWAWRYLRKNQNKIFTNDDIEIYKNNNR
jgi:hypothetical protein